MRSAPIMDLDEQLQLRQGLIEHVFNLESRARIAHDIVANRKLSVEQRTKALVRLQALLRYQRDSDIRIDHIWEMHEVAFTQGFSLEQVQGVIQTLTRICLAKLDSKKAIDVNMVRSILTDLIHIAGGESKHVRYRIYGLEGLKTILRVLPVRYLNLYESRIASIIASMKDLRKQLPKDQALLVEQLEAELIELMWQCKHSHQIIELTEDDENL
jgi:hypothetical protein